MGPTARGGPRADPGEIAAAIQLLSDPEWIRIGSFAGTLLWGTAFEIPEELVNETIERFLSGSRSWPTEVPFLTCFCNAMKSVADGDRELVHKHFEVAAWDLRHPDAEQPDESPSDVIDRMADKDAHAVSVEQSALTEERRLAATHDLALIQDSFRDDEQVNWILMGIEDGIAAAEVQSISGMTQTEYETARKRLRRKLTQLFKARRQQ